MRKNLPYFAFIILWVAADQISKAVVSAQIPLLGSRPVVPGFFNLTVIHNKGAIFGFFGQHQNFLVFALLTLASTVALGFVIYYFINTPPSDVLMKFSLSFILAGACGNLADRLFRGYVVDFLDFYIGKRHWPFFNLADTGISLGAGLLILAFFRRKP
jgi:signal peptidase II